MYRFLKVFFVFYFLVCLQSVYPQQWPQWRGPRGTGAALSGNPPIEWSEKKNIKWKTRLPGTGHSTEMGEGNSPAFYKDRLVLHWDHYGHDFITVLQASTGQEIWRKKRDERISWTTPLIVEESGGVR